MIHKLINPSKTDDVLFLAGVVLNIMNEENGLKPLPRGNKREKEYKESILPELFLTLGLEGTINLIKFFDGQTITVPSHAQMYNSFLVLVCYYKKKIEDKSWDEIRDEVGVDISPHALGKIIKCLDDRITIEVEELKKLGIEDLLKDNKPNGKEKVSNN